LDTLGSTPERTVFDTSDATMSSAPLLDLEEAQANSEEPAKTQSAPAGQADVAHAQASQLDFRYDPEISFDEELQPTKRHRS
jgi:hypothetical protein